MEKADMIPGRPQQLPYASPPDKKTSQEKSGSNIVVEWMSAMQKMDMPCLAQTFIRKMKNFKGLLVCVMQLLWF